MRLRLKQQVCIVGGENEGLWQITAMHDDMVRVRGPFIVNLRRWGRQVLVLKRDWMRAGTWGSQWNVLVNTIKPGG